MIQLFKDVWMLRRMNWMLMLATLALLLIGVFFIYSSCYVSEDLPVRSFYKRQMVWIMVGMVAYVFFAIWDYRQLGRLAGWLYGMSLILLVAVLFVGTLKWGARRWLMIFGIGVQPSELAKLAMIMAVARYLSQPRLNRSSFLTLCTVGLLAAVPFFLILAEPDLGTAMIFVPTVFAMMFVGGIPWKTLGTLVAIALIVVSLVMSALFLPEKLGKDEEVQARFRRMTGLSEYQYKRIKTLVSSDYDLTGAGWNKMQAMIAVGSGGMWGKGYCRGTQNILGFLPRSVAPTDFIYSVVAEEKGFAGSVVVLALFGLVIAGGLQGAMATPDMFGRLLSVGIVGMIFCHVFINIAMTIGLMPITGLPLPLLSYGGSFMIVMMSALGILQSVYIRARRVAMF